MSIIDQKKEIFGNIAAKRILNEGLPKLQVNPSFPSINNDTNPLTFLTDLLTALVGLESLQDIIVNIFEDHLDSIELNIKNGLKRELNNIVSCDINPQIPQNLIDDGVDLDLKKIDFNNLFLTSPNSSLGKLLYIDDDLNTFIYNAIQNGGDTNWNNILTFKFNEVGQQNNILNIRVNSTYAQTKKLKDLNNDFIDNIDLFDSKTLLNDLIDDVMGSITSLQTKTQTQLLDELKVKSIIDKVMNQNDDMVIDDSFFEFNNEDLTELNLNSVNKIKGVKVIDLSNPVELNLPISDLNAMNIQMDNSNSTNFGDIMRSSLDSITNVVTNNVPKVDQYSVKLDFISDLVKNLMKVIGSIIMSPKVMLILSMNHQIIYGEDFDGPLDFMVKNKYFIKEIFETIRDSVLEVMLDKVLKEIEVLALETASDLLTEQIKNTSAMISSLVGVPYEITRQINGVI